MENYCIGVKTKGKREGNKKGMRKRRGRNEEATKT